MGSMLNPQGYGSYSQTVKKWFGLKSETLTCAMGAAVSAMGCLSRPATEEEKSLPGTRGTGTNSVTEVPEDWGVILWLRVKCPACSGNLDTIGSVHAVVAHLNDIHRWSREAIADWVETIEPKEAPTVVAETEEVCVGR